MKKFCILYQPRLEDIAQLIDDVYNNMRRNLLDALRKEPGRWLALQKQQYRNSCSLLYWSVSNYYQYFRPTIGNRPLTQYISDSRNLPEVLNILEQIPPRPLLRSLRGGVGFHQGSRNDAYDILQQSKDSCDFFDRFIGELLRKRTSKNTWGTSYGYKLIEPMILRGWLLHPISGFQKFYGEIFYSPLKHEYSIGKRHMMSSRKVFADYPRKRMKIMHDLANERHLLRGEGEYLVPFLRRLIFCSTVETIGDISEELCHFVTNDRQFIDKYAMAIERPIIDYMQHHPEYFEQIPAATFCITPDRRRRVDKKQERITRADGTFRWILQHGNEFEVWQSIFAEYCPKSRSRNVTTITKSLNPFLIWIQSLPKEDFTRCCNPDVLDRFTHVIRNEVLSSNSFSTVFSEWLLQNYSPGGYNSAMLEMEKFYNWYQTYKNPGKINPFSPNDRVQKPPPHSKSVRDVIPTRILNLMKDVLTKNDFEWAKQIDSDWSGGKTGLGHWSPARAVLLLTLLTIPIRSDSALSADCGLKDEYMYDTDKNDFIINPIGIKGREAGILRRITEGTDTLTGLYFTRNKTSTRGIQIPWDNPVLKSAYLKMRALIQQQKAIVPHNWAKRKLTEHGLREQCYPVIYPLFLDLGHSDIRERRTPVSPTRLRAFFNLLLVEVEKRFNQSLEGHNSPLNIASGIEHGSKWTLHGLRVTGITNFALAGLPPQIIAEFLSGHSSILMNLYYTKYSPSLINELISSKCINIDLNSDLVPIDVWKQDRKLLELLLAANDLDAAVPQLRGYDRALYQISRGFICPNGGSLCHEGGLGQLKNGEKKIPVKGGKANCPQCRYAVTGPMLLIPQLMAANSELYDISEQVHKKERLIKEMEDARNIGNWITAREKEVQRDSVEQRIESLFDSWIARVRHLVASTEKLPLWDKIKEMMSLGMNAEEIAKYADANEHFLPNCIVNDDEGYPCIVFEKGVTKEEVLVAVASAGQVSTIDAVPTADAKLVNLMTRALLKSGIEPFILNLDEDNATRASVLLSRFLTDYFQQNAESIGNKGWNAGLSETARVLRGESLITSDGTLRRAINHIAHLIEQCNGCVPTHLDQFKSLE